MGWDDVVFLGKMDIEEAIGYSFADKSLLNRALTRKAHALEHQSQEDHEIFSTLGDAVLKTVLTDLLIRAGCKTSGDLTTQKEKLEDKESLAEISQGLGIGRFIKLGVGEEKQKINKNSSVLANILEAIIGAIYLDRGFEAAKDVITRWCQKKRMNLLMLFL